MVITSSVRARMRATESRHSVSVHTTRSQSTCRLVDTSSVCVVFTAIDRVVLDTVDCVVLDDCMVSGTTVCVTLDRVWVSVEDTSCPSQYGTDMLDEGH